MRLTLIAVAAVAALLIGPTAAEAQYDPYGNTYRTQRSYGGGSTTYGSNPYTGNTWTNRSFSGGNQSGVDSQGNSWSYNKGSGIYQNYGTGEIRSGKGAARQKW